MLGSGSEGNAALIECANTTVLLDCGFSLKETLVRLERLGRKGDQLTGILITHEHGDHVRGVGVVARRLGIPVWLTAGTYAAIRPYIGNLPQVNLIHPERAFSIGDIGVQPFPVPHDAREPCQFVFNDGDSRLGFLTDTGSATAHLELMLSGCDALVLECNHDREMLRAGSYPASLKERIAGPRGHLDNATAAGIVSRIDCSRLRHVVAAHLSQENNTPARARAALAQALGCAPDWIEVADQELGVLWRQASCRDLS